MSIQRVVILTQYFPPESGAPSIRLMAMARELRKLGVDVRVITGMPNYPVGTIYPGYKGRLTMSEEVERIPVRRVWLYPAAGRRAIRRLLNYLSFTVTGAIALAFAPKPDLVFVEAQPVTLAIPAWILKHVREVPYIYNTPDLQVEHAAGDAWISVKLLIRAAAALESKLMRDAACVTTVTHSFIEHFHKAYGVPLERLTFLPNGADTERLRPLPPDEALAERLGVAGKKVFTYAGTMANYQGLEVLVDVAERLRDRHDIVILMVGSGPVKERLLTMIAERGLTNIVLRTSPFEEMPQLMSITTASLVVLRPIEISKKMRLSKAIPPLACGVPIIYAGWGETAEVVAREEVGIVAEPGNADAIAAAIQKLAGAPQLVKALGARGRLLAEREFSWTFLVTDWMRQLRLVLDGEDRPSREVVRQNFKALPRNWKPEISLENTVVMRCPSLADLPPPPPGRTGWPWTEESVRVPAQAAGTPACPRFTVVTPSFNQGHFIEETIRSILLQGYPNLEFFVLDGGSTDDTVEIVKKYAPWIDFWVSERDGGQSAAINRGLKMASGSYATWINSDDLLCKDALATHVSRYGLTGDVVYVGDCINVDEKGHVLSTQRGRVRSFEDLVRIRTVWRTEGYISQPAVIFPLALALRVGGVNEANHYTMDYELWGRFFLEGATLEFTAFPSCFRSHSAQKTQENTKQTESMLNAARELIGVADCLSAEVKEEILADLQAYQEEFPSIVWNHTGRLARAGLPRPLVTTIRQVRKFVADAMNGRPRSTR